MKGIILYLITILEFVHGQIKSFSDAFPDKPLISLNETLNAIYSGPKFEVKKHYLGSNFKLHHDGKISSKCTTLFHSVLKDHADIKECKITQELKDAFTMDRLVLGNERCPPKEGPVEKQNGSNETWIWTNETISTATEDFPSCAYYGNSACEEAVIKYNHFIKDKVGMVLGTQVPWAEGGLLKYGAKEITTVEYNPIISQHPQVKTLHPADVAKQYINEKFQHADFVFSYSSLEHDGLGR